LIDRLLRRLLPVLSLVLFAGTAHAQGGPPFLTTDPGTPGNGNWELNLGAMVTRVPPVTAYQLPQLDLNLGIGERVQLTWEVPYVLQAEGGEVHGAWGNSVLGAKWRFLDKGAGNWQASVFPQLELAGSATARALGIAGEGPRLLLPLEVARRLGPLDVNLEVGYYIARHGPEERFVGLAVGRAVSARLELDAEIFADRASGELPDETTLDAGLRYHFNPACILMAMAGRSISGEGTGHTEFMGYLGVQILLSEWGRALPREH